MLAKLEQDSDITLQSMSEECQRFINQKHVPRGVMVIVVGNAHSDTSSNPG